MLCVMRDDEYIRSMLKLLAKFNRHYVRKNLHPPTNFFFEDSEYQQFLRKTLDVCADCARSGPPKPQEIKRVGGIGEPFFADGSVTLHNEYRTEALPRRMRFKDRKRMAKAKSERTHWQRELRI